MVLSLVLMRLCLQQRYNNKGRIWPMFGESHLENAHSCSMLVCRRNEGSGSMVVINRDIPLPLKKSRANALKCVQVSLRQVRHPT